MGKGGGSGGDNMDMKKPGTGRKITIEELGGHRTMGDAWMAYKGRVYDVSNWYDHPGGSVMFTHAGDDFTDIFTAFHPPSAIKEMERFYIGDLDDTVVPKGALASRFKDQKQKDFEKAYRELRTQVLNLGLFNPDFGYYTFKVLSNFAIVAAAAACAIYSKSFLVNMIGAILLGLFWQQCGWLSHDFLHHQVFKNRLYGDLVGIFIGDVCQGFSVDWWKSKHNTHHAVPNLHESCAQASDGDPDIDTMPLLAWSPKMASFAKDSAFGRFMISHQTVFYFPLLLFARLAWAQQSWVFVWGGWGQWFSKGGYIDRVRIRYLNLEKAGLLIHYAWVFWICSHMPLTTALCYLSLLRPVVECSWLLCLVSATMEWLCIQQMSALISGSFKFLLQET